MAMNTDSKTELKEEGPKTLRDLFSTKTIYAGLEQTPLAELDIATALLFSETDFEEMLSVLCAEDPSLRVRGLIFLKAILRPLREASLEASVADEEEEVGPFSTITPFIFKDGVCSFSGGRLVSLKGRPMPGQVNVTRLKDVLQAAPAANILDLSSCHLMDEDLPIIAEAVSGLQALTRLDLSDNRLHGVGASTAKFDEALQSLLRKNILVNVMQNPTASIDRREFFRSQGELLRYLVWIPEPTLRNESMWAYLVQPDVVAEVKAAHEDYFSVMYRNTSRGTIHGVPSHEVHPASPLHVPIAVTDALQHVAEGKGRFCRARSCMNRYSQQVLDVLKE